MSVLLTTMLSVSTVVIGVSMLMAAGRVLRGPDDASRIVVADLIYFCALALFVLLVIRAGSRVALDALLLGSLLGVLSTVALARLLTRGRR